MLAGIKELLSATGAQDQRATSETTDEPAPESAQDGRTATKAPVKAAAAAAVDEKAPADGAVEPAQDGQNERSAVAAPHPSAPPDLQVEPAGRDAQEPAQQPFQGTQHDASSTGQLQADTTAAEGVSTQPNRAALCSGRPCMQPTHALLCTQMSMAMLWCPYALRGGCCKYRRMNGSLFAICAANLIVWGLGFRVWG